MGLEGGQGRPPRFRVRPASPSDVIGGLRHKDQSGYIQRRGGAERCWRFAGGGRGRNGGDEREVPGGGRDDRYIAKEFALMGKGRQPMIS